MYFFYLDETGCSGAKLNDKKQPIFVLGGVIVNDKKWNEANSMFLSNINEYFENLIPKGFELHAEDIFNQYGKNYFSEHSWEKRKSLIYKIFKIINDKSISIIYSAIDKNKLFKFDNLNKQKIKEYFNIKIPYLLAFDYLISCIDNYTKENLSQSSRSMIILDKKDEFNKSIEEITRQRRYIVPSQQKVKWIVEFSTPVDSKKNTFIQMSDLIIFIIRKFLEIENKYREGTSMEQKNGYKELYSQIHDRIIYKKPYNEKIKKLPDHQILLDEVLIFPSLRWKNNEYV